MYSVCTTLPQGASIKLAFFSPLFSELEQVRRPRLLHARRLN